MNTNTETAHLYGIIARLEAQLAETEHLHKTIARLEAKLAETEGLHKTIANLEAKLAERDALIIQQQLKIQTLEATVVDLRDRLNKNSRNSSKPPSSDGLSKPSAPVSLRKKGVNPSGGQKGHAGCTLKQTESPTHVIRHLLKACPDCGENLANQECLRLSARQVVDIPVPQVEVTEHQIEYKHCGRCKKTVRSAFPETVTAPVQYGPNIRSWSVYYQNQHFIPQDRLQHLFLDLYGLKISTATLAEYNEKAYERLKPFQEEILKAVQKSEVKHLDETGYRINGKLSWLHTISTIGVTYYHVSVQRKALVDGLIGTVVHDHWKPYFQLQNVQHALCNQHHMRELLALVTSHHSEAWAERMLRFFRVALRIRHRYEQNPIPEKRQEFLTALYRHEIAKGLKWHESLAPLPQKRPSHPKRRKGHNLLLRLSHYEGDVLRFLKDPTIPFTNNLAEQDLRMMKTKLKVSGCFRSNLGADYFASIRGFISTSRKQGWSIFAELFALFLPGALRPAPS